MSSMACTQNLLTMTYIRINHLSGLLRTTCVKSHMWLGTREQTRIVATQSSSPTAPRQTHTHKPARHLSMLMLCLFFVCVCVMFMGGTRSRWGGSASACDSMRGTCGTDSGALTLVNMLTRCYMMSLSLSPMLRVAVRLKGIIISWSDK